MPLTTDYKESLNEYDFINNFRKSCHYTIDYCLRRNYRLSPRAHIWLFNNFEHRNEFEDFKE